MLCSRVKSKFWVILNRSSFKPNWVLGIGVVFDIYDDRRSFFANEGKYCADYTHRNPNCCTNNCDAKHQPK